MNKYPLFSTKLVKWLEWLKALQVCICCHSLLIQPFTLAPWNTQSTTHASNYPFSLCRQALNSCISQITEV